MGWWEEPFISMDFETTGTDVKTARIVQAALIRVEPDGKLHEKSMFGLVNPEIDIPADATMIHGITTDRLKNATKTKDALDKTFMALASPGSWANSLPLVVFNTPYDWPLLLAEAERCGLSYWKDRLHPQFIDPLCIDRHWDRYRKGGRKLDVLAPSYGINLSRSHKAKHDAIAAAHIARQQTTKFPLSAFTLAEMQAKQVEWHRFWRDSTNEFFQKIGRKDVITGEWPKD